MLRSNANSQRPRPGRRGFTLIVLLPAVQSARESARQLQCRNNLKQIGIAVHGYLATANVFPKAGFGGSLTNDASLVLPAGRANKIVSWGTALLPGLEQMPLYNGINHGGWYLEPMNLSVTQTALQVFLCPSNPAGSAMKPNGDNQNSPLFGRNDYAGNYGERALRCYPKTNCQNTYADQGDISGAGRGLTMLAANKTLRIQDVLDGTSTTILAGEAPEALHGLWAGHKNVLDQSAPMNSHYGRGASTPWASCQALDTSPLMGRIGCDFGQEFHSHHSGGVNFVYADGSVHFLAQTINNQTFAALLSRRGKEIISQDY
jgi:prepilin-type processing-associated H-X9-DG protein